MPFLIPLVPVITAIAAAGSAAVGIDEIVNRPGTQTAPATPTGPQPLTQPQSQAVKAAVGQDIRTCNPIFISQALKFF